MKERKTVTQLHFEFDEVDKADVRGRYGHKVYGYLLPPTPGMYLCGDHIWLWLCVFVYCCCSRIMGGGGGSFLFDTNVQYKVILVAVYPH